VIRALAILGALISGTAMISMLIGWSQPPGLVSSALSQFALCIFCIRLACE
jgi:hypothetical protein